MDCSRNYGTDTFIETCGWVQNFHGSVLSSLALLAFVSDLTTFSDDGTRRNILHPLLDPRRMIRIFRIVSVVHCVYWSVAVLSSWYLLDWKNAMVEYCGFLSVLMLYIWLTGFTVWSAGVYSEAHATTWDKYGRVRKRLPATSNSQSIPGRNLWADIFVETVPAQAQSPQWNFLSIVKRIGLCNFLWSAMAEQFANYHCWEPDLVFHSYCSLTWRRFSVSLSITMKSVL